MILRLAPLVAGLALAIVSCSDQPEAKTPPGETEVVRFSVPKLDG